jgi:predicted metallo-beta-lactamase superfamily hydrolase
MSHNETSTAKIDHKNEINAKNWVRSTWVAKNQLWKKSTLLVKVNEKVNPSQRKKSTPGQ